LQLKKFNATKTLKHHHGLKFNQNSLKNCGDYPSRLCDGFLGGFLFLNMDLKLSIINWQKYNGRKDVDHPSWFRFQNDFFYDNKISNLTNDEKLIFLLLLCEASKAKNELFFLDDSIYRCVHRVVHRISDRDIDRAIEKYKKLQLVEVRTVRGRYANVNDPDATRQDKTLQDKTEQNTIAHSTNSRLSFDFEIVYKNYPRKLGKGRGIAKLKSTIKTDQDYQDLIKSIELYKTYLKNNGTEVQFIQHFSTFVNSWRDWLDPQAGTADKIKKEKDWSFLHD